MKKLLFLVIISLLIACTKEEVDKGIVDPATMTRILIDIHITEAKINSITVAKRDSSSAIYLELQDGIFKKYGVTKENYKKSYSYYNSRPDLMDKIYEAVVDSLNVRQKLLKID